MTIIAMIAVLVVAAFVSAALAPKQAPPKPSSLSDFDVPTADEGREIPVVFGTVTVTGPNVIWYGDFGVDAITAKGGKK